MIPTYYPLQTIPALIEIYCFVPHEYNECIYIHAHINTHTHIYIHITRGVSDKSLVRPTSSSCRAELILSLERGVSSCVELQVFS